MWMIMRNLISICSLLILGFLLNNAVSATVEAQQKLEWHSFEDAIVIADSTQKPIFIDVWAPWCGWCRKMNRDVYPVVSENLNDKFVLTKLNRDDNETHHNYKGRNLTSFELAKLFNTETVPAIVMLNSSGTYLTDLSGFIQANKLKLALNYISSEAYKVRSFESFLND